MAKIFTTGEALTRMQTLCARAEHCSYEIDVKLQRMGMTPDKRSDIISNLRDNRFIDDRRFAIAFARDKARFAHWGKRKIAMTLRLKRIDTDTIMDAISEVDDEIFTEGAAHSAKSKASTMQRPLSFKDKTKIYAFLSARGFDSHLIRKAISLLDDTDE